MIRIHEKKAAFDHICRVYDEYAGSLALACHRGCAACCTTNVIITSLEAWILAAYLDQAGRADLFDTMEAAAHTYRQQPQQTLNSLAAAYHHQPGETPAAEEESAKRAACPLLSDEECPVYPARPFACRCLVSQSDCRKQGYARVEPLTITVGHVMQQYIEHVDRPGVTGNMLDLVPALRDRQRRDQYAAGEVSFLTGNFLENRPAVMLLAGAEEGPALEPILAALNRGGPP
ncbi:MAG: hypothetical protein ACLFPD_08910 [Desulfosudaceae bacterium]